jgi:signal transduction histidine kinase
MTQVHLRFATEILKRFGEELNPSPDQGILELAKNAYDADARKCTIELISTNEIGGTIRITDDGDGMDKEDIINGWLVLGRSSKLVGTTTPLGRAVAGNKGLGRLAALRMGSLASLVTRPKDDKEDLEYQLDIDWSRFNEVDVVEDVDLIIQERKRAPKAEPGTVITLSKMHSRLNRADVKSLARGLLLLADPFNDNPSGFQPILKAPEFKDLEKQVQARYFNDAEFHLIASVNANGLAHASVTDYQGKELFVADHKDIRRAKGSPPYTCPVVTFDLWVFILASEYFTTRQSTIKEVREWLKEFGGVHLYIRGIRVAPYGNPGNDWLDMNLSRVQHPEVRPATNSAIGRIRIEDLAGELLPKTDRSGLVEGESFRELKTFATDALAWMARRRLDERNKRLAAQRVEAPKKVERAKESISEAINYLPKATQEDFRVKFEQYDRARDREVQTLRKEVQLYRTLSTAGITAAVFAHESRHPVSLISRNARQVERQGKESFGNKYIELLHPPVDRILRQADTLEAFSNLTLSFIAHEKRRTSRVEIHNVINNVISIFNQVLTSRKVSVTPILVDGNPYLRGSEAAVESIITNLLVNSLKAFEEAPPGKHGIEVRTQIEGDQLILRVLDNGPGIQSLSVKDIWLPGETSYPNGTGLGLTIVRDTVKDLGGEVDAVAQGELGGAEVIIEVPILGA